MGLIFSSLETLTLHVIVLDDFNTGFITKFFSYGINL